MFLMAHRLTKLHEEGRMSHEQASLVKAWNTSKSVLSAEQEWLA